MKTKLLRRQVCLLALSAFVSSPLWAASSMPIAQVWKSPSCGCCKDWVRHLEAHGFSVQVHNTGNNSVRQRLRMPVKYGSCHTAKIGKYVIEGHVPADDIKRMLKEGPDAIGLAVPGMPVGSPGMDGEIYGERRDAYDVLIVDSDGSARVFNSYR